ncbi:MAG TPA: sulfotransferase [Gammaproteobacteria bacterium]|nr:sulfotransferase [Gammaproteobacteria bacterium]
MHPSPHTSPSAPERLLERALALLQAGQTSQAAAYLKEARTLYPRDPQILYHLGNSLRLCGAVPEAVEVLETAIDLDPGLVDAWFSLAFLHIREGRNSQASELLIDLCKRFAKDVQLHRKAADLLAGIGAEKAAATLYEGIVDIEPGRSGAHMQLALLYQKLGHYAEAESQLNRVIALDPGNGAAYMLLANSRQMSDEDRHLEPLFKTALNKQDATDETRSCLHFGLGKLYDDWGAYDQAFDHYRHANQLKRGQYRFDREAWREQVCRLIAIFDSVKPGNPFFAAPRPVPGFIVGMLRSGTTLLERLLTTSDKLHGLGETERLDAFIGHLSSIKGVPYPECVLQLEPGEADLIAADFRRHVATGHEWAMFVLDKNPLNFMHVGLIALLFPDSPIFHCRRDALDTCLSVYFQNFAHARNNYAYDLDDIAAFYAGYEKLMSFWETAYPGRLIHVEYEKLVEKPESVMRGLYEKLQLDWVPDAIQPRTNPATISTASVWQARQSIYTQSIGRWRNYSKYLSPLKDALGEYRALYQ